MAGIDARALDRFYKVTTEGRRVLAQQRRTWDAFVEAVRRVTEAEDA
jgi:DNA-binding PadR family transcriptional regulator